jgi:UDP-2,3-diacylglucosamine pyrophosphatase LpxH
VLVHASPAVLNEYLFEDVADDVFQKHLDATGADVLIFGHTHKPFQVLASPSMATPTPLT